MDNNIYPDKYLMKHPIWIKYPPVKYKDAKYFVWMVYGDPEIYIKMKNCKSKKEAKWVKEYLKIERSYSIKYDRNYHDDDEPDAIIIAKKGDGFLDEEESESDHSGYSEYILSENDENIDEIRNEIRKKIKTTMKED
jgi:hypothetical protein